MYQLHTRVGMIMYCKYVQNKRVDQEVVGQQKEETFKFCTFTTTQGKLWWDVNFHRLEHPASMALVIPAFKLFPLNCVHCLWLSSGSNSMFLSSTNYWVIYCPFGFIFIAESTTFSGAHILAAQVLWNVGKNSHETIIHILEAWKVSIVWIMPISVGHFTSSQHPRIIAAEASECLSAWHSVWKESQSTSSLDGLS